MHPHATIADHNLGIDFVNNTCVSQQIFGLFSINGRIRLLSLMSESLKGVPFVSLRVGSVYYLSRVMSKPAFCIYAKTKVQINCAITAQLISSFVFAS